MLTKEKALYQVKLILDYLPKEEYALIPQEEIDYIEENFEYDENISINPNIPLEEQKIDDKAQVVLKKIIKKVNNIKRKQSGEVKEFLEDIKKSNKEFDIQLENIKLKKLIDFLKKENSRLPKAKELCEEYKKIIEQKDKEISELKTLNKVMEENFNKIPKFLRKIFIKESNIKLLK